MRGLHGVSPYSSYREDSINRIINHACFPDKQKSFHPRVLLARLPVILHVTSGRNVRHFDVELLQEVEQVLVRATVQRIAGDLPGEV